MQNNASGLTFTSLGSSTCGVHLPHLIYNITALRSNFTSNVHDGLAFGDGSQFTIDHCNISDNGYHGISIPETS
jgi:hypothetical protein